MTQPLFSQRSVSLSKKEGQILAVSLHRVLSLFWRKRTKPSAFLLLASCLSHSLSLCKCVSLCPSVPLSICDYGSDVSVLLFPNLFSLCLYLCLSLPLYLSLPSSVSLSLSPSLFVSLKSLCMFLCLSLCLPHSLFSSRPSVTLPTFPVHCRENIQQLFFARARSLTAGTNIEKFRINWVLIICQQKKKILRYTHETKDNLATVETSARSNKNNPNEA